MELIKNDAPIPEDTVFGSQLVQSNENTIQTDKTGFFWQVPYFF